MAKKNYRVDKLVKKVFTKVFKETKEVLDVKLPPQRKRQLINSYQSSKKYNEFCKVASKQITEAGLQEQKQQWKSHYNSLKSRGVSLPSYYEIESNITKKILKENFKFIQSIPEKVLELNKLKYLQVLQSQILEGTMHRKALENMLNQMGVKYAKVISRTETSRLQTSIIQTRSSELGSSAYLWLCANDQRTRESHRKMKGVLVLWETEIDKKPFLDKMHGNPGEFPNCRCSPEPVFDESDLPKTGMIRFYSYKKKKTITIKKGDLGKYGWDN